MLWRSNAKTSALIFAGMYCAVPCQSFLWAYCHSSFSCGARQVDISQIIHACVSVATHACMQTCIYSSGILDQSVKQCCLSRMSRTACMAPFASIGMHAVFCVARDHSLCVGSGAHLHAAVPRHNGLCCMLSQCACVCRLQKSFVSPC